VKADPFLLGWMSLVMLMGVLLVLHLAGAAR
jgi:hypothetical protein